MSSETVLLLAHAFVEEMEIQPQYERAPSLRTLGRSVSHADNPAEARRNSEVETVFTTDRSPRVCDSFYNVLITRTPAAAKGLSNSWSHCGGREHTVLCARNASNQINKIGQQRAELAKSQPTRLFQGNPYDSRLELIDDIQVRHRAWVGTVQRSSRSRCNTCPFLVQNIDLSATLEGLGVS